MCDCKWDEQEEKWRRAKKKKPRRKEDLVLADEEEGRKKKALEHARKDVNSVKIEKKRKKVKNQEEIER